MRRRLFFGAGLGVIAIVAHFLVVTLYEVTSLLPPISSWPIRITISGIVLYWLVVTTEGMLASARLAYNAFNDWEFEHSDAHGPADRHWVAIDLLVTAIVGFVASWLFFCAGALIEMGTLGWVSPSVWMRWPYYIAGGVTCVTILREFKLYSRRRLYRIQDVEEHVA